MTDPRQPHAVEASPLFGWPETVQGYWDDEGFWDYWRRREEERGDEERGSESEEIARFRLWYIDFLRVEGREGEIPDTMRRHRLTASHAVLVQALASFARKGYGDECREWMRRADAAALSVRPEDLVVASV